MFFDKLLDKFKINDSSVHKEKISDKLYVNPDDEDKKYVQDRINEAKALAIIINTTIDNVAFYSALNKIIDILSELQKYEDKIPFSSKPSFDLERILTNKEYIIENFNDRVNQEISNDNNLHLKDNVDSDCHETFQKVSAHNHENDEDVTIPNSPYESDRIIIKGLHPLFISVMREIVDANKIVPVALMREYHLAKEDLHKIFEEGQNAHILDNENNILMSKDFFEKFIDHYDPSIYKCKHSDFDKELLICIGEIAIENGADTLYEEFDPDDILDYLEILENMNVLSYNSEMNKFDVLVSMEEFHEKCMYIPSPSNELTKNINLENLDKMEGHDFEYACAEILKKNHFNNVTVTSGSGDHGVDIFAYKSDISYAIQCKRYNDTVPNDAVQAAFSAKNMFKKDIAVVMTNSYLSPHGMEEAESLNVKVWDREKLKKMISNPNDI